jgi:hypothetical protein
MGTPTTIPTPTPSVSDRAAQAVLLGVIAIFLTVLVAGWSKLLAPSLSADFAHAAWGLALGIALIAVLLAKGVAAEIVRLGVAEQAGQPERDKTWWAYFAVLLTLSSLATMNTAFYYGEGRLVLTEVIDKTHRSLDELQAIASSILVNPQFNQKAAKINSLLVKLEEEIRNPRNCGEGQVARGILEEIRSELPGFHRLSGNSLNCKGLDEIISSYKNQANRLLRNSPDYVAGKVGRMETLLIALRERVAQENKKLDAAKSALAGARAGSEITSSGSTYVNAQEALESASTTYSELVLEVENASGKSGVMPRAIAVDHARQLGSIAQIIPSLLGRLDRISTYLYILAAVFLDVILIMCFMRVLRGVIHPVEFPQPGRRAGGPTVERDLKFLWVDPY